MPPLLNEWKSVIERYGNGGFVIAGKEVFGNILLTESARHDLSISALAQLDDSILPLLVRDECEILLVGYGDESSFLPKPVSDSLKSSGIAIEYMNTGAACRTYGILQSEGRRVSALLIAI